MTIDQILTLEPDLKQSIRKYQAIGKTGMLNGRKCDYKRLMQEISETVKCYCAWSKHAVLQTDDARDSLTDYLRGLCQNIKEEKPVS